MYFMVNTDFVNYLNSLTNSLNFLLLLSLTMHKQNLPIPLQSFHFNPALMKALKNLKDFVYPFQYKKEIFDLQKRHNNGLDLASKNSFSTNYTIASFFHLLLLLFH